MNKSKRSFARGTYVSFMVSMLAAVAPCQSAGDILYRHTDTGHLAAQAGKHKLERYEKRPGWSKALNLMPLLLLTAQATGAASQQFTPYTGTNRTYGKVSGAFCAGDGVATGITDIHGNCCRITRGVFGGEVPVYSPGSLDNPNNFFVFRPRNDRNERTNFDQMYADLISDTNSVLCMGSGFTGIFAGTSALNPCYNPQISILYPSQSEYGGLGCRIRTGAVGVVEKTSGFCMPGQIPDGTDYCANKTVEYFYAGYPITPGTGIIRDNSFVVFNLNLQGCQPMGIPAEVTALAVKSGLRCFAKSPAGMFEAGYVGPWGDTCMIADIGSCTNIDYRFLDYQPTPVQYSYTTAAPLPATPSEKPGESTGKDSTFQISNEALGGITAAAAAAAAVGGLIFGVWKKIKELRTSKHGEAVPQDNWAAMMLGWEQVKAHMTGTFESPHSPSARNVASAGTGEPDAAVRNGVYTGMGESDARMQSTADARGESPSTALQDAADVWGETADKSV